MSYFVILLVLVYKGTKMHTCFLAYHRCHVHTCTYLKGKHDSAFCTTNKHNIFHLEFSDGKFSWRISKRGKTLFIQVTILMEWSDLLLSVMYKCLKVWCFRTSCKCLSPSPSGLVTFREVEVAIPVIDTASTATWYNWQGAKGVQYL